MSDVLRKFPYQELGNPPKPRPAIDVVLSFGKADWTTKALIDTGSPYTLFDYATATALSVHLGRTDARKGKVALLGDTWDVQFEFVDISLLADTDYTWQAEVAFVKSSFLTMPFQGLLGTEGFLDKFAVTFDKYYDYFVIERPDDYHERVGKHLDDDLMMVYDAQWGPPA